jgi:hypothetical protein
VTSLERYVRRVADLMDLGEWDIEVKPIEEDDGPRASMSTAEWFAGPACLGVKPKAWKKANLVGRRWLVVHELMHLHLQPFSYLGKEAEDGGYGRQRVAEEIMVERLTKLIAPTMPLPPKAAKP